MKRDKRELDYSYMEFITAGPRSPWHIRQLTDSGKHLTGGIDTAPLCGRTYGNGDLINGWDLEPPIEPSHDGHTCTQCLAEYKQLARGTP